MHIYGLFILTTQKKGALKIKSGFPLVKRCPKSFKYPYNQINIGVSF